MVVAGIERVHGLLGESTRIIPPRGARRRPQQVPRAAVPLGGEFWYGSRMIEPESTPPTSRASSRRTCRAATCRSTFSLISGGRSNLTYLVRGGGHTWVLRRPPLGHVLPTAHDMAREYRVLAALADTDVPVARPIALCEDAGGQRHALLRHGVPPRRRARARAARRLRRHAGDAPAHQPGDDRHAGAPARGRLPRRRPRGLRPSRGLPRTPGAALGAAVGALEDRRRCRRSTSSPRACAPRCRRRRRRRSCTATSASATWRSTRTIPAASSPSSTGRWRRSATRSPTSATR